jgi:hypothetical protein
MRSSTRPTELARRFEEHEPKPGDMRDARSLRDVAKAFRNVTRAEEDLAEAIAVARAEGHSDESIRMVIAASR